MTNWRVKIIFFALSSCGTTGVVPISSRAFQMEPKRVDIAPRNPVQESDKRPQTYVKRREVIITPKKTENEFGSLVSLDDAELNLYSHYSPVRAGDLIRVEFDAARKAKEEKKGGPPKKEGEDELEKLLRETMKSLEPGEDFSLLKSMMMKVSYSDPKGRTILVFERESTADKESKKIHVQAEVPSRLLRFRRELKSSELGQIKFIESLPDEIVERASTHWEDEYTLRISGFTEATSKMAEELSSRRKDLLRLADQLRKRLENIGRQRRKNSQDQERLTKEAQKQKAKLAEMEEKLAKKDEEISAKNAEIAERKAELAEKNAQIAELQPAPEEVAGGEAAQ